MLQTKFQGHPPFGSREEDFLRFLPYIGMVAILVRWPGPFEHTFLPPSQGGSIWNLASIGPVVLEKMFEKVDNTHIRTTEAYLDPISSSLSLKAHPEGSGELKKKLCWPTLIFFWQGTWNTTVFFLALWNIKIRVICCIACGVEWHGMWYGMVCYCCYMVWNVVCNGKTKGYIN